MRGRRLLMRTDKRVFRKTANKVAKSSLTSRAMRGGNMK